MKTMLNVMRAQAMRAGATRAPTRFGEVTNYNPDACSVRVRLQPDDVITGWLPLASLWVGNGWGMFAAPSLGDLVAVHFMGDDLESGVVQLRAFNDVDAPLPVPSGEFWLVHASGQAVKLTNDGKLSLIDGHGASITLNGDGSISSAGSWTHNGTIHANGKRIDDQHHHVPDSHGDTQGVVA